MAAASIVAGERRRHRARHVGDRAVPDGDARHVERPARRDRRVRLGARVRRRPACSRTISPASSADAIAVCGIGALARVDLPRPAPSRVAHAGARRREPDRRAPARRAAFRRVRCAGMSQHAPTVVLEGLAFPEGPRWHDGHLVFSDQHDRRVVRMDPSGKAETLVEVPRTAIGARLVARRAHAHRVDARSPRAPARRRRSSSSTPTCPAWRPASATTWWSTRTVARTSATSASTCTAARSRARRASSWSSPTERAASRPTRLGVPERDGHHRRRHAR